MSRRELASHPDVYKVTTGSGDFSVARTCNKAPQDRCPGCRSAVELSAMFGMPGSATTVRVVRPASANTNGRTDEV